MSPGRAAPPARRANRSQSARTLPRSQRYAPAFVSVGSTLLVLGIVWRWISTAEQWPRIRHQFFNAEAIAASLPRVWRGFLVNMSVWLIALVAIAIWALVLAMLRSSSSPWMAPLRVFVIVYIDVLRGLPALLLVLLFGFGIPALQLPGLPRSSLFWGATALVLGYSAYAAEVYRSGMEAVHDGQWAAAKALGLSPWQTLRYAIVPQAIRNVVPALLNLAVALQKDVALLSALGVRDAVREAQIFTARTFNYSSLVAAALLFLVATIPMARLADHVTRRDQRRRLQRTTL